jgi:hypothetical protein
VLEVATNSGRTVENIGGVAGDAVLITSTAFHGAKAADGVRQEAISSESAK